MVNMKQLVQCQAFKLSVAVFKCTVTYADYEDNHMLAKWPIFGTWNCSNGFFFISDWVGGGGGGGGGGERGYIRAISS